MALAGPFGCDVEQVELARAKRIDRLFAVFFAVGTGQAGGADSIGLGAAQLIVHQRDQRADHHAGPGQGNGGKLIGQALARAGWHNRQGRLTGHDPVDHAFLHPAKGGKAESGMKLVEQRRTVHDHGGYGRSPNAKEGQRDMTCHSNKRLEHSGPAAPQYLHRIRG